MRLPSFLVVAVALVLAACVPLARDPVGGRAAAVVDPALAGEWRSVADDGEINVRIGRGGPSPRDLRVVVREPRADGRTKETEYGGVATRTGVQGWLNIRYEEAGRDGWLPLRYQAEGTDRLLVRFPDTERMARAIEAGQLAGNAEREGGVSTVELGDAGKVLAGTLGAGPADAWFGAAQVFERVVAAPRAP